MGTRRARSASVDGPSAGGRTHAQNTACVDPAVLTGLFGVGGVLVGGGVTAWSDRESENRRTISEAVAAARLVHLELYGLQTRLDDAVEDAGDWRWIPEPPLTPVLDGHASTLAPVLTAAEWGNVATLAAQCRFTEPLLIVKRQLAMRMFDELPENDPRWTTATDIEPDDKEIVGRIAVRIQPALDALTPLINGDRATRTQRVMRVLKLTPRTLGC
jgi:hypothetical protein